jgi:hypothetical protein
VSGSVSMVIADKEQRIFDDKSLVAMLDRAAVAFAHQESDEACIALPQLVRGLIERDARTVHDGKIGGEDAIERNEAVIQDWSRVLR